MKYEKGTTRNNKNGRPVGSKNKITLHREKLEASLPGILEKLLGQAKEGDLSAIKLVLERTLPPLKSQSQTVMLPMSARNPAESILEVIKAMAKGEVSPDVGKEFVDAISQFVKIQEISEIIPRLEALEKRIKG